MNELICQTEGEARQLAARYFADSNVEIFETIRRRQSCVVLRPGISDELHMGDATLYAGPGRLAAVLDVFEWTLTPTWKRGLWIRLNFTGSKLIEWDGEGKNPAEEFPTELPTYWFGPLPYMPK